METPADAVYCSIAPAVVKRCKTGFCEENFDLNKYCGLAFTKPMDGKSYYFNCEGGGDCQDGGKCSDGSKPIITQCKKDNLEVKGGKCKGTEEVCKDTECQKMNYQPPK